MNNTQRKETNDSVQTSNHSSIANWLKNIPNCTNNNIYKNWFRNLFVNYFASGAWNAVNFNRLFINFHILHFIINRNKKGEKKIPFLIVKWSYCTSPSYIFSISNSSSFYRIQIHHNDNDQYSNIESESPNTIHRTKLEQQKRLCKMWTRDIIHAPLHLIHLLVSPISLLLLN